MDWKMWIEKVELGVCGELWWIHQSSHGVHICGGVAPWQLRIRLHPKKDVSSPVTFLCDNRRSRRRRRRIAHL